MSISFYAGSSEDEHLNLSNANAMAIMQAAGIQPDYCGTIALADIPAVLRTIMVRLAGNVSAFTRAPVDEQALRTPRDGNLIRVGRGPRIIDQGIDEEYVRDRLRRLQTLLVAAQRGGHDVNWS